MTFNDEYMTFEEFGKVVRDLFPEIGETQIDRFKEMDGLYKDWNSRINVISRKDIDGLYLHHVMHSIAIAGYLKERMPEVYAEWLSEDGNVRILDLGTGGGFPGIPLAIMFPNVRFTLCDSIGKKITVASEVSKALGLGNVETVNARAESLEGRYDWIVSRAVTSLDKFMPWVRGKYGKGVLYLKGGDVVEEIASIMGPGRLQKGSVGTWKIDSWYRDPYFDGKLVIFIQGPSFLRK